MLVIVISKTTNRTMTHKLTSYCCLTPKNSLSLMTDGSYIRSKSVTSKLSVATST